MRKPKNDCEWNPELYRTALPHERHAPAYFYMHAIGMKFKLCKECANSITFSFMKRSRINKLKKK